MYLSISLSIYIYSAAKLLGLTSVAAWHLPGVANNILYWGFLAPSDRAVMMAALSVASGWEQALRQPMPELRRWPAWVQRCQAVTFKRRLPTPDSRV